MSEEGRKFTRTPEDFTCEHCNATVIGDGYTNHCPKCLWSRHVDNFPGDRGNGCRGMMEPVGVEIKSGDHVIIHRCEVCGETRPNRRHPDDDFDTLLRIAKEAAQKN